MHHSEFYIFTVTNISYPFLLVYLYRHPQRLPLGLWVAGWKQHWGYLHNLENNKLTKLWTFL